MRKRGRPPGPAKQSDDIELVWFVRNARDDAPPGRFVSVEQACARFRRTKKNTGPAVEQLVRRYKRIATAYPDRKIQLTRQQAALIMAQRAQRTGQNPSPLLLLFGPLRPERMGIGTALLTIDPIRPPSKY